MAECRDHVTLRFQGVDNLLRQFHNHISVKRAGVDEFDAIDINHCIIVVRIVEVYRFPHDVGRESKIAAHPDLRGVPFSSCQPLLGDVAKRTHAGFPRRVIEIRLIPVGSRLVGSVFPCPALFGSRRQGRVEDRSLSAHETIMSTVDSDYTYQRVGRLGPVSYLLVIEIVRHRPGARVGVDSYQRISRCAE